ncbi:MAG: EAL domain-containing response regulator [Rhizobiaceae bacterium]|nr:EAL domain-containing response regulator [Rhizobiaceae bacterium]
MTRYQSVLIVDDDPTQITLLTSYFIAMGARKVDGATNAAEAVSKLLEHGPDIDLIVTDLQMPKMDGLEFMRNIKDTEFAGKFAIVSGVKADLIGHAARLAKMHSLDFIGQIKKPITKDSLDAVFLKEHGDKDKPTSERGSVITQDAFSLAMRTGEIIAHYQPKVSVKTGKIEGAEALARWIRSDGTMVPPEDFVRFASNAGRMNELTFHLFDTVLKDLPRFVDHCPELKVAINLDAENIRNRALPDQFFDRMNMRGIKPKNLSFEVTESNILDLDVTTLEVLSRLRVFDFDVAVDDFGTGSSNIQTLRDFPYSELKIDKTFISDAITNAFSKETVKAAVGLARQLDMNIVAEGVEDIATWEMIQELGVDQAQGFLVSKAMPRDDFLRFITENPEGIHLRAA